MTRRTKVSPKFADSLRSQEASRKKIVLALKQTESHARWMLDGAVKLRAFFERDLEIIRSDGAPLRDALLKAFELGVQRPVENLLGIESGICPPGAHDRRSRLLRVLFPDTVSAPIAPASAESLATPAASVVAVTELSADRALAEASKIIANLSDADLQIDWADNPKSEREAAVRAAIIRRVEAENIHLGPWYVQQTLENLCREVESDELGEDMYEALEKWEKLADENRVKRHRSEQQRLIDQARRDLDGGAQP